MTSTKLKFGYLRRHPQLVAGTIILLFLALFASVGRLLVDPKEAYPISAQPRQAPSMEYPLGTDIQGRNLLAVAVVGTYLTSKIGVIAGTLGITLGTILGFITAYFGGWLDRVIKIIVDVLLTIPQLLILVVIASSINEPLTTNMMALVVASLSWMWSTRTVRSQDLSLRERAFVRVAKLSGEGSLEIIFRELMPNLLPLLGACLVSTVMGAVFVSLGLEVLGLGPQREPTLGMTMYWMSFYGAFNRGMWWWIATPVVILVMLFVGLYLVSAGLDEIANPKLRRKI